MGGFVGKLASLNLLRVEFAAVIIAFDVNGLAHLEEATSEADADAVFECLVRRGASRVEVVGGEDGQLLVVVARADDLHHRVFHPVGRLRRAEFVEH
jgi:hypothetical protein